MTTRRPKISQDIPGCSCRFSRSAEVTGRWIRPMIWAGTIRHHGCMACSAYKKYKYTRDFEITRPRNNTRLQQNITKVTRYQREFNDQSDWKLNIDFIDFIDFHDLSPQLRELRAQLARITASSQTLQVCEGWTWVNPTRFSSHVEAYKDFLKTGQNISNIAWPQLLEHFGL